VQLFFNGMKQIMSCKITLQKLIMYLLQGSNDEKVGCKLNLFFNNFLNCYSSKLWF
jgi:hypothetical protein